MPVGAFDRLEPQRAVGAGAGQDDPDGPLSLVLRQRAEEIINRQPQRAGFIRLHQVQRAVEDRQVTLRRATCRCSSGFDAQIVVRPATTGIAGALAQQLRQQARVAGMLVRHHHKRHPAVWRHLGEELLQRLQSAGGSAQADDGKGFAWKRRRDGAARRRCGV